MNAPGVLVLSPVLLNVTGTELSTEKGQLLLYYVLAISPSVSLPLYSSISTPTTHFNHILPLRQAKGTEELSQHGVGACGHSQVLTLCHMPFVHADSAQ